MTLPTGRRLQSNLPRVSSLHGAFNCKIERSNPGPVAGFFCQKTARGTLPGAQACGLHGMANPPREAAPHPNQSPRLTAGGHWPPRARHGALGYQRPSRDAAASPRGAWFPSTSKPTRLTPGGWKPPRAGARCPTPPSNPRSWIFTRQTIIRRFAQGDQAPHCVWCANPPAPSTRGGEVAV